MNVLGYLCILDGNTSEAAGNKHVLDRRWEVPG